MKKISLFFKSFKKNFMSFLILIIILSAVMMALNYTVAEYLYSNRATTMFEKGQFDNGLHFINITPYDRDSLENLKKDIKTIEEYKFINKVIYTEASAVDIGGEIFQLEICDEEVYSKMYHPLLAGEWKLKDGENFCVVVGGVLPKSIKLNDIVQLKSTDISYNDATLDVKISGIIPYPPMIFRMSGYVSAVEHFTVDMFFNKMKTLYLLKNDETYEILDSFGINSDFLASNGIIIFNDDVTEEEIDEVKKLVGENAELSETKLILESSKRHVKDILKRKLPLPLFMLLVTTLSYISIAVLNIYKNKENYTIYHLSGCDKDTMAFLSAFQVVFSIIITTIIVCTTILVLSDLAAKGDYTLPNLIFGWQNIILTCGVSVILFAIVTTISSFMMKNFSPVEQLRLVKE